jgi:uncharacterized protein YerC
MLYNNLFSGMDTRGLNKIVNPINYLKNKSIIERKKQYDTFNLLLNQNKKIKKKEERLSYKDIEQITGISKRTYYRIKQKVEIKGSTFWKALEKESTRPNKVRQSNKIPNETIELILKLRTENITYGKDKIAVMLYKHYNISREDI